MLDIQGRKYVPTTCCDVTLYDLQSKYPVMYFDTLKITNFEDNLRCVSAMLPIFGLDDHRAFFKRQAWLHDRNDPCHCADIIGWSDDADEPISTRQGCIDRAARTLFVPVRAAVFFVVQAQ